MGSRCPLADKMPSWSPYSYAFDNPIRFADPTGIAEQKLNEEKSISEIETITKLASINLKPKTFEKLKEYLFKQKRISKDQLKIIELVIKNDE